MINHHRRDRRRRRSHHHHHHHHHFFFKTLGGKRAENLSAMSMFGPVQIQVAPLPFRFMT